MISYTKSVFALTLSLLGFSCQCNGFAFQKTNMRSLQVPVSKSTTLNVGSKNIQSSDMLPTHNVSYKQDPISYLVATIMATIMFTVASTSPANAVSGGGLDFAGLDISGQDFSNNKKSYKGKDFTQVLAKATNFANSNLQGCRFYKAYLVNTDFSNADISGAAMEDTNMEGSNLKNTVALGAYFGQSLIDVESAENADFTDATIPVKTLILFCEREDVKGVNPVTGADTKESLMCP